MLQVSELFIYPIKSLGGIALNKAVVTERGFEHDRRWMLVDKNNRFLSQREVAEMALLKVDLKDSCLQVTYATGENILIPFEPLAHETCQVVIWDDTCTAIYVSNLVDEWFTKILGIPCRLVYMPDNSKRQVDEGYAPIGQITSFSDAYPFMIIGQATLDDLNNRLAEALPMDRFRPNIVFTGGKAFEEDLLDNFTIGNIRFNGVKLCARCILTTINQDNAVKAKEPLKTLAGYRRKDNKIYFGQNLIHVGNGIIKVGDAIGVINYHYNNEKFLV
ncbi:MOSC domain-containing protein [Mucilaginibacter sp. X5P1]|uniref:MOSC domain-containing protein n=1 Tax=Mucilaginibacter sp. X5P1 TaxID=2723088 RepID=UPI0016149EBB|nr:MOSC N-terminal beta barrel domain-containing protein [Mucilaginibacter sp. X5P1]MBB6137129.1 hypothetical protein [Mucilaginibacter sp. X5P1]